MTGVLALVLLGCGGGARGTDSSTDTDPDSPSDTVLDTAPAGDGCDTAAPPLWYLDLDGDGYGDGAEAREDCWPDERESALDGDCDVENGAIYPGAYEDCNGVDDDCDGVIDEDDAEGATRWYPDADGDGFGDEGAAWRSCTQPTGYTATGKDCDDSDEAVYPSAREIPGDGVDNDCDGADDTPRAGAALEGSLDLEDAEAKMGDDVYSDFGTSVTIAGDLNGDGLADLAVGAPFEPAYDDELGSVYVFLGMPGSFTSTSEADAHLLGEDAQDYAGRSVAGPGDVDGDGYDDLLIGAPYEASGGDYAGATYLVSGPVTGSSSLAEATSILWGEGDSVYSGYGLSGGGDLNGDGLADLVIGATDHDDASESLAYIVLGPISGVASLRRADATLVGRGLDGAGRALAAAGDVDGDGLADLAVGAYLDDTAGINAGAAFLVLGPISGDTSLDDAEATLVGEAASDYAGTSVAGGQDMDGDGLTDLLVGAPYNDTLASGSGAAYLIRGAPSGTSSLADADARMLGVHETAYAGVAVALVGDVTGDGGGDLLVSAPYATSSRGVIYLVTDPSAGTTELDDAVASLEGDYDGSGSRAGYALDGGGDVSGDGVPDMLIGAPGLCDAYLVLGCCGP